MHLPTSALRRRVFATALAALVASGVGVAARPDSAPATAPNQAGPDDATAGAIPEGFYGPALPVGAEAVALQKASAAAAAEAQAEPEEEQPKPKVITYTVVEGDTIEDIAHRYGVSTETLLYINDMYADDILHIGQELLIPTMDALVYTVVEGDTMWGVADAFDADFDAIVAANPDVNADALQPGDILFVPGGTPPSRRTMVASRGGSRTPAATGTFDIWPVWGGVTDWFGWRVHPVTGVWHLHDGIDLDAPTGTPVAAVASGTVTTAGWLGGYGYAVKVDHGDGIMTMYAHLSQVAVSVGEWVETGEIIGYSGSTGNSTGPHLHFTVLVWGEPVDPWGWLP
ncbi:peptidoglycan DD-metalloendopeptidase family protein [Symbiobacterium thermophilum]|uniref:peptidoglycan DD-metalloendopeptidase family protein n=1 Tax=Symbiobacterium thermophilum TaxID=2734 RepID=UPI0035C78B42